MNHNNENIKNSREVHTSLSIYDFSKADANMYKNDKLSIIFGQKTTNIFKDIPNEFIKK
ncbi:hypothetical protein FH115_04355 [Staphylococcus hominis]|uniref:hypothetical protein n=1 Tax=Staphylococcus hominis TaxID=1290 RepID=UPI001F597B1B|nr:hypothetical protein [Staphylococcus hominis]MCI2868918.1 hypothetical protein [Staphylococcus hominis]MDS3893302.1 hypothetical protein [Staphylococcus hominis]